MNFREKYASYNFALLLFCFLSPYFVWFLPSGFIPILLIMSSFSSVLLNFRKLIIDFRRFLIMLIIFLIIIHFTSPLVHDMRLGHFLLWLSFMITIPLNSSIKSKGYKYFKTIIVFFSIFALLYWILDLLNVTMPYVPYHAEGRDILSEHYRLYGPAISLHNIKESYKGIYRICGIFGEPGHYGIYIAFILAIDRFRFTDKNNIFLFIVGLFTFSTAYYGLITFGLVYRIVSDKGFKMDVRRVLVIIVLLLTIGFIIKREDVSELIYRRVLGNKNNVSAVTLVEDRATIDTKRVFHVFTKSSDFFLGKGYNSIGKTIQFTNWRGFAYGFGIFGLILSVLLLIMLSLGKNNNILYSFLLLAMTALVFSHRSWMMCTPQIYLFMMVAYDRYRVNT